MIGPSRKRRWESLHRVYITCEVFIVLVGVLEIFLLVWISAEADAQTVEDEVLLRERDLAVLFLAGERLLNFDLFRFRHAQ